MKKFKKIAVLIISGILITGCAGAQKAKPVEIAAAPVEEKSSDAPGIVIYPKAPKIERRYDGSIIHNEDAWGGLNVHDPSVIKAGDTYYIYSTDVKVGGAAFPGIQIRKSKNLIDWQWVGYAFPDGVPEKAAGWTGAKGMWAPDIIKAGDKYMLFYCASMFGKNTSFIGVAESKSPEGPWKDLGEVVKSDSGDSFNAIDPNPVYDKNGDLYMSFGSFWEGIFIVKLDKDTGKPISEIPGKNICQRPYAVSGAVEGPYITYNKQFDKYYLFVSYGSLMDDYNVRVGRADRIDGPYYDALGNDMTSQDVDIFSLGNKAMGGYKWGNEEGYRAPGHNSVLNDNENYYIVHHTRYENNMFWPYLNVRKILWSRDGWPMVSPERYAGEQEQDITAGSAAGNWQVILHQKAENEMNRSENYKLNANGEAVNSSNIKTNWTIEGKNTFRIQKDGIEYEGKIIPAWDWEQNMETLVFTALDKNGTALWGKKIR